MNAPLLPERLIHPQAASAEPSLDLATAGVLRVVWASRFGAMLIEVRAGAAYVNGQRVEPAQAAPPSPPPPRLRRIP
ncbi:MAG: hypothetical protein H6933_10840 [Burkholderiaceae bacterium]|nr:hypothetical protein [Burkholderiaceae bacterium]